MVLILKSGASEKELKELEEQLASRKDFNIWDYCGMLKVDEDPLIIQQKLRDEWS